MFCGHPAYFGTSVITVILIFQVRVMLTVKVLLKPVNVADIYVSKNEN